MMKSLALVIAFLVLAPGAALADDPLVRFEGGIGSSPAALVGGVLVANTARGVNPGGRPWVIAGLSVDVRTTGRISADGQGLLLAGGDGVGTTGNQSVRAKLFCGPAATQTVHDSELVPLEPNGDFRIGGELTPPPPETCTTPVLLIVSGGGSWFAAGIPAN